MYSLESSSQRYRITFILVAVNIAVYVYTSMMGGSFTTYYGDPLNLGQSNFDVLYNYAYYQLFTAMFVHNGVIHLAGNMLFLIVFGLRAEEMFSIPEYLAVYLLGGLAGNLLSLALGPALYSVGASGAIFAMFGAVAVYARRSVGQSIIGAVIFGFFLLIISSGENTNYMAHIGGLAAGLAIGYILARRGRPRQTYAVKYTYTSPF